MYFGTLGRDGHSWWPLFLYPLIWPWSWAEHFYAEPLLLRWLANNFILFDYIIGAFYIVFGTLWFWIVGKMISMFSTSLFCSE